MWYNSFIDIFGGELMNLSFLGAAGTVTGSCFLLETENRKYLVDCGMFQGSAAEESLNEQPFPINPADLDCVFLTHAHIDHSGRIPKLFREGFKGDIVTTKATAELCAIMLPDSGHIQEFEAEWENRKRRRAGKPEKQPLYTIQDALDCLKLFKSVHYDELVDINDEVTVRFRDAGHILGSAIIEMWVRENGSETKIVFSGDLGNWNMPILRDPTFIDEADYVIIESTYGNRLHEKKEESIDRFIDLINDTVEKGGNVIIPSFAVGRTQEIIYELNKHIGKYNEKLAKFLNIQTFIDSPLAISATEVFRNNLDCFDEEAREYIANGDNPLDFPGLTFTRTAEESKALNERTESCIIISASGMCEAGRTKHHLKHNLWREDSTIIFVGYQAEGTLGRRILDGAKKVRIFGEEISVNARVEMIHGLSGHADRDTLMKWLRGFKRKPERIFIVHGEDMSAKDFASLVESNLNIETVIPLRGDKYVLDAGRSISRLAQTPKQEFLRLELLNMIETLREQYEDMAGMLVADLKKGLDDSDVNMLKKKLEQVQKAFLDVLA